MRFLFLNQYAPPDPAPTARLLGELADHLRGNGHEVEIVSPGLSYHGRPARGGGRLLRELKGLFAIVRSGGRSRQTKPDIILALSSPPGLLMVAAVLAWRHRAVLAHWAMDLYPELATALSEIRSGGVGRSASLAMGWAYRRAALVIALDEDMRTHLQARYQVDARVLAPWLTTTVAKQLEAVMTKPVELQKTGAPWTWLYSGNLGRAHEWETLLAVQRHLEARELPIHLIFQGDGAARAAAQLRAHELGLTRCHWNGYVAESELVGALMTAQLLIVTQRPETRGLLWPSKLALLVNLPVPILWVGPIDGAIAGLLRAREGAGVFAPGAVEAVADWIETLYYHPPPAVPTRSAVETMHSGCALLERWLLEVHEAAH